MLLSEPMKHETPFKNALPSRQLIGGWSPEKTRRVRIIMMEKTHLARLPLPAMGAAAIFLVCALPAAAKPKPNSCPLMITACGCVITRADTYTAINHLSAEQTDQPNCIEIAAGNAILNLDGFNVVGKGDGTGIGILIRKGADNVIVEGGRESNNTPAQNPTTDPEPMAPQSRVNLWKIGIEDDGDNAIIALFSEIGGTFFQKGNSTAGVLTSGVKDSFIGDLKADFNGKYGLAVKHSSGLTLANFSADNNRNTGLLLDSSAGNSIGPGGAANNGSFGLWLRSSSRNTIHDSNGNMMNGNTGILLSCASGADCPDHDGSNENSVTNAGAPRNKVAGIVIQLGNLRNTVTVTHNEDNGEPHSDMIDLNPDCDHNVWYNNVGSSNNPSCIR
jgi:Right handed beta helix region